MPGPASEVEQGTTEKVDGKRKLVDSADSAKKSIYDYDSTNNPVESPDSTRSRQHRAACSPAETGWKLGCSILLSSWPKLVVCHVHLVNETRHA